MKNRPRLLVEIVVRPELAEGLVRLAAEVERDLEAGELADVELGLNNPAVEASFALLAELEPIFAEPERRQDISCIASGTLPPNALAVRG